MKNRIMCKIKKSVVFSVIIITVLASVPICGFAKDDDYVVPNSVHNIDQ